MLNLIFILSLAIIILISVIEKFNFELGINGNNYVVVIPKDNCNKTHSCLYLKVDYEKLTLSEDMRFNNKVFEKCFDEIQKIQLDKNMLYIDLNETSQFKFEVPKLNLKMLERILLQLQEYKNGLAA